MISVHTKIDKHTVLVVDDEPSNIEILAKILQPEYRVIFTTKGANVRRMAEENCPDLVLLDVVMPGMDGYEVCRELKKSSIAGNIPVIFVTAMREEEYETTGFEVGGADYVTKPVKPFIIKARIRTHIELKVRLNEIMKLRGLLPICSVCKKIRDDSGYWNQMESYICRHSDIVFSHSYCPACAEKAMKDLHNELGNNPE